jgi:hypothetical protein
MPETQLLPIAIASVPIRFMGCGSLPDKYVKLAHEDSQIFQQSKTVHAQIGATPGDFYG